MFSLSAEEAVPVLIITAAVAGAEE